MQQNAELSRMLVEVITECCVYMSDAGNEVHAPWQSKHCVRVSDPQRLDRTQYYHAHLGAMDWGGGDFSLPSSFL